MGLAHHTRMGIRGRGSYKSLAPVRTTISVRAGIIRPTDSTPKADAIYPISVSQPAYRDGGDHRGRDPGRSPVEVHGFPLSLELVDGRQTVPQVTRSDIPQIDNGSENSIYLATGFVIVRTPAHGFAVIVTDVDPKHDIQSRLSINRWLSSIHRGGSGLCVAKHSFWEWMSARSSSGSFIDASAFRPQFDACVHALTPMHVRVNVDNASGFHSPPLVPASARP